MSTNVFNLQPSATATLVVAAGDGPHLIANQSPTVTVYIGDNDAIKSTDTQGVAPISPSGSVAVNGENDVFVTAPSAAQVTVIQGGMSFFQPPNLGAIGGISTFVQNTQPTGTPGHPIPNNSIWFDTANQSLWVFQSGTWTQEFFNAANFITAGTIIASLIAAGTIVAGIVNGTTITGSTINGGVFNGTNWVADANGTRFYSGTPATNNLIGSIGSSSYTDAFSNVVVAGVAAYNPNLGAGFSLYVQMNLGGINIGVSSGSDETTGWTAQVSGLGATSNGILQYVDASDGNLYYSGRTAVRMASNQPITSTSPTQITNMSLNVTVGFVYHITVLAIITADQAAGSAQFGWDGSSVTGNANGVGVWKNKHGAADNIQPWDGSLAGLSGSIGFNAVGDICIWQADIWANFTTGGTINLRAQESTAGDSFHIKSCLMVMEQIA